MNHLQRQVMVVMKQVPGKASQKEENKDVLHTCRVPGLILITSLLTFSMFIHLLLITLPSIWSHTFFQGLSIHWPSYTFGVPIPHALNTIWLYYTYTTHSQRELHDCADTLTISCYPVPVLLSPLPQYCHPLLLLSVHLPFPLEIIQISLFFSQVLPNAINS